MSEIESGENEKAAERKASRARLLGPIGFIVAAAAGLAVGALWPDAQAAPRMQMDSVVHMAPVRQGESLVPQPKGLITDPQVAQRFVVWSQPVFRGELSEDTVEAVIAAERAESLDKRLCEEPATRLRESLFDVDQEIMQLGEQYREEYERIGADLRAKGDRVILIKSHPREKDPAWPQVERLIARVRKGEGVLNGKYVEQTGPQATSAGKEPPLEYVFIAWDQWPAFKRIRDRYDIALYERILRSRRWITGEYKKHGLGLFQG